jgi:hypothetical protein
MAEFFKPNKPNNANAKTRRNALIGKYSANLERFRTVEGERTRLETEVAQAEKVYDDAVKARIAKTEGVPLPTVEQLQSLMKLRGTARYALMTFNWMNPKPLTRGGRKARGTRRSKK